MRLDAIGRADIAALSRVFERFLQLLDFLIDLVALGPGHRRTHQHQGDRPVRMLERKVDGEPAAHRRADQDRRVDAEPVEHRFEVDQVVERHIGRLGLAVAAPVIADDVVALGGQLPHLFAPHPAVGDAGMQEHHRNAETGCLAANQRAVEVDFKG